MTEVSDAYCLVTDLLLGNVPTPAYLSPQKVVNDAADEIDSHIGFLYRTRVDISDTSPVIKPARLLLKRLNVFLATGRLLMEVAAAQEDKQIHAYAVRLLDEVSASIQAIVSGHVPLEGAPKVTGVTSARTGPLINNKDEESAVDAFYDRIANPYYIFPWAPGVRGFQPSSGFVRGGPPL